MTVAPPRIPLRPTISLICPLNTASCLHRLPLEKPYLGAFGSFQTRLAGQCPFRHGSRGLTEGRSCDVPEGRGMQ